MDGKTHHELTQKYLADLSRVNYKNKEKSKSMAVWICRTKMSGILTMIIRWENEAVLYCSRFN